MIRSHALLVVLLAAVVGAATGTPVVTRPFEPRPITIALDALPAPHATPSAQKAPRVVPPPDPPVLRAPAGFAVTRYYEGDLEHPRWLALSTEGDVLVTETSANRIRGLRDVDHDGVADEATTFADRDNGLDLPFGMAFTATHFCVGDNDAVVRFPHHAGQAHVVGRGETIATLPGGGYKQHWTRNVRVAPDGTHLFVTVGSKSNDDVEAPPRASVLRMKLDGSERETFADGLRNPVGLDFEPETGDV